MSKFQVMPNILDDSRKGTKHEMNRGVYVRLTQVQGPRGAALSVSEARALADELQDLADQIEARFEENKARPLGLSKGSLVRLNTGAVLVLDDPLSKRPFRVVANANFVPGTAAAPRWAALSVESVGYEVLIRQ